METNIQLVEINKNEKEYHTKDVAEILNCSDQDVRNYCKKYNVLFDKTHISGKHRVFFKEDINTFKLIRYLSKEKNFKPQQIIKYLTRSNKITNLDLILSIKFLFDDVRTDIIKDVRETMRTEIQSGFQELKIDLEQSINQTNELIQTQHIELLSRTERNKAKKKHWYNKIFG